MIQNQGFTKTVLYDNNKEKMSEIKWDANYDGNNAHVLLNINKDGKKQKIDMNLDNSDLAKLLNIPNVTKPLDERLMRDFDADERKMHMHMPMPMSIQMIELPPKETPYTHISSPRSFEEFIKPLTIKVKTPRKYRKRHTKTQKLTKVRKSKSKPKSKTHRTTTRKYTL